MNADDDDGAHRMCSVDDADDADDRSSSSSSSADFLERLAQLEREANDEQAQCAQLRNDICTLERRVHDGELARLAAEARAWRADARRATLAVDAADAARAQRTLAGVLGEHERRTRARRDDARTADARRADTHARVGALESRADAVRGECTAHFDALPAAGERRESDARVAALLDARTTLDAQCARNERELERIDTAVAACARDAAHVDAATQRETTRERDAERALERARVALARVEHVRDAASSEHAARIDALRADEEQLVADNSLLEQNVTAALRRISATEERLHSLLRCQRALLC